jgi:DNA-directed RNA polymerase specialized sigma24 family protein
MHETPTSPSPPAADPAITVEAIMARLVAGDVAAIFTLHEHHGHRVAGVVRRQLRRCGVDRITPEDLQGLVLDACMELVVVAPSWRPGGALPWWWAEGRIRAVVNGWVDVHADDLDDHLATIEAGDQAPAPTDEDTIRETFARLVDEVPLVGLVAEAARAAKVDDLSLCCLLDYSIQQDQGDPSPAHTLADRYGVTPEALRQRVSRTRRRLRAVVDEDPRFVPLAGFALVA